MALITVAAYLPGLDRKGRLEAPNIEEVPRCLPIVPEPAPTVAIWRGARGLWRATGMTDADFGKPIIAIANSFTQFVPGHVHLKDLGQLVAREIEKAGGVAKEFTLHRGR